MKLFFKIMVIIICFNSTFQKKEFKSIEASQKSLEVKRFIDNRLSKDGGIYTNYLDHSSTGDITKGHDVLSESQGLYMYYSVLIGDKNSFDKAFYFVRDKMTLHNGLVSWRVRKEKSDTSALIDDLKIIEALYNAYNLWGDDEYKYYLIQLSYAVASEYKQIRNFPKGNEINLSYLNINGMKIVAMIIPSWANQVDEAQKLLDKGYINDQNPLYYEKYNFKTEKYGQIDMLQTIITHLNSDNMVRKKIFIDWVEKNLEEKKEVLEINGIESTAVYSLVGQLALEVKNLKMADMMEKRIQRFQIKNDPYLAGGFGDLNKEEFYSFDNLTAMIFLGLGGH